MSTSDSIRFVLAQENFRVGDLVGNSNKIMQICEFANKNNADVVIFPEMALSGYPIQDLIFDRDFFESELKFINQIGSKFPNISIILGGFGMEKDPMHHPKYQNNAFICSHGKIQNVISKRLTPTYDVFDEKRYFWSGNDYSAIKIKDFSFGIAICEDLWDHDYNLDVAEKLTQAGAEIIISINGSPYHIHKQEYRESLVVKKTKKFHIPIIYVNAIGGQDELVFDGRSFICDSNGDIVIRGPFCKESLIVCDYNRQSKKFVYVKREELKFIEISLHIPLNALSPMISLQEEIVEALAMNLRDYYIKTGVFKRIVLGLSGGVDSAFTAVIAARAIGKENVVAILMPSKYSSQGSIDDSIQLCQNLGIQYHIIPIKPTHQLIEQEMDTLLSANTSEANLDLAHQNLQSRIRGVFLMYYSNKYDALLVSTGNKSEIATGYCTLYGDTNGGKNVPGDLYKTQLYDVCRWINLNEEIIPVNIITKPPSAELKEDQKDEDNLPPYSILDEILTLRIDEGFSPREIVAKGYEEGLVKRIEKLYTNAEFKRAQLAQTIKINKKTFGSGRKIPVLKHSTY